MTAGLVIWGAHLGLVYAWTALACARGFGAAALWGLTIAPLVFGLATGVALAFTALILAQGRRVGAHGAGDATRFAGAMTVLVAAFAMVAILWTGLPAAIVPVCDSAP